MPAATSYTEATLAAYMQSTLKEIAVDLGWTDTTPITGHYVRPVQKVEQALEVTDIADATEPTRLIELHADVEIWKEALAAYVRAYAASGIQRNLQRQQLFDHTRVMLAEAQLALEGYLKGVVIEQVGEGVPAYSTSIPIKIRF